MSLDEYIKWCRCNRRILTTEQMRENKPCLLCQQEHADTLKNRVIESQQKEDK